MQFDQTTDNFGLDFNAPTNIVQWPNGRNIRFRRGAVYSTPGKLKITTPAGYTGTTKIFNIFTIDDRNGVRWSYVCSATKIWAFRSVSANFDTVYDVTPVSVTSTVSWSYALMAGLLVLCNGANYWWIAPELSASSTFQIMTTTTGSGLTAAGIIPAAPKFIWAQGDRLWVAFGNNVGCSGIANPFHWGLTGTQTEVADKAAYGFSNIQPLTSKRMGFSAAELPIGAVTVGDGSYVFTDNHVWRCSVNDGILVATMIPQDGVGMKDGSISALADAQSGKDGGVYYIGLDDFLVFDGNASKAIGEPIRNIVFQALNNAALAANFSFYNQVTNEVFFCVCTGNNTSPDTACVYNIDTHGWTVLDWNSTAAGFAFYVGGTFTADLNWDGVNMDYINQFANGMLPYTVLGDASGYLYIMDGRWGDDVGGTTNAITAFIESTDYVSEGTTSGIHAVYPKIKAASGQQELMVQTGSRRDLSSPINWNIAAQFNIANNQTRVLSRGMGWYNRVKFYSNRLGSHWTLGGYMLEIVQKGRR